MNLDFSEAPDCFIGLSKISGEGLFAGRNFKKGEVVVDYSKSFSTWEKMLFTHISNFKTLQEKCWFVAENKKFIRIGSQGSVFMRSNHSRTPNTEWNPKSKILKSYKKINIGDEITYDYRLEIGPNWFKTKPPVWA